jgi:hypothetical protein
MKVRPKAAGRGVAEGRITARSLTAITRTGDRKASVAGRNRLFAGAGAAFSAGGATAQSQTSEGTSAHGQMETEAQQECDGAAALPP